MLKAKTNLSAIISDADIQWRTGEVVVSVGIKDDKEVTVFQADITMRLKLR